MKHHLLCIAMLAMSFFSKAQFNFNGSLPGSAVGTSLITLSNPSSVSYLRLNADNTATALSQSNFFNGIVPSQSGQTGKVLGTNGTIVSWVNPSTTSASWDLAGNVGTDNTNFVGTTDQQDLIFKTNSVEAMRIYGVKRRLGLNTLAPESSFQLVATNKSVDSSLFSLKGSDGRYILGVSSFGTVGINLNGGVTHIGTISDAAFEVAQPYDSIGMYCTAFKSKDLAHVMMRTSYGVAGESNVHTYGTFEHEGSFGFNVVPNSSYAINLKGLGSSSSTFNLVCTNSSGANLLGLQDDGKLFIHLSPTTAPFITNAVTSTKQGVLNLNSTNCTLANAGDGTSNNLNIFCTDAVAQDKGAGISLYAMYQSGEYAMAGIFGRKESSTNTNSAGYLQLSVHENATGGLTERVRIASSGAVAFGGASNYGSSGQVLTSNGDAVPTWNTISSSSTTITAGDGVVVTGTSPSYTVSVANPIYTTTLSLTASDIKNANSTPIQIVPAPGAGYAIEVLSACCDFTYGGTAFTNSYLTLLTETAAGRQAETGVVLSIASSTFSRLSMDSSTNNQIVENKKLTISANANSAVGNGTAKIYLSYRIVAL